jgi:hypothetical protein
MQSPSSGQKSPKLEDRSAINLKSCEYDLKSLLENVTE